MTTGPQPANVEQSETTIRKTVASHSYQRSVIEVHQEFDQLNPQAIGDACQAWKRAADELLALADGLKAQAATPLDAAWTAPSSPASQQQLQQAEATARALANDCLQMAHATDYAAQYAQWYKDHLPAYTDSVLTGTKGLLTGNGLTAGADAATEHMVKLLGRYNEVIQILPSSVQAGRVNSGIDTYQPPHPPPPPITNGGAGAGTAHAGSLPGLGSPGATSGHGTSGAGLPGSSGAGTSGLGSPGAGSGLSGSGIGAGSSGLGAADPYAAGSLLAGTGLGGGLSSFDPGALGSGGTGLGAGGLAGGLGAGSSGSGLAGSGLAGSGLAGSGLAGSGLGGSGGAGSLAGQGIGGTGAGLVGEEAGAAGAGRGVGTAPMHGGGGHGEGEEERERSTWLMEDDDVWGTGGDVPPPVITS
jgi:hypothetical protein